MAEKILGQKWSISYLWEHFLVPEHRIPIWLILKLGFRVEDVSHVQQVLQFLRFLDEATVSGKNKTKQIYNVF